MKIRQIIQAYYSRILFFVTAIFIAAVSVFNFNTEYLSKIQTINQNSGKQYLICRVTSVPSFTDGNLKMQVSVVEAKSPLHGCGFLLNVSEAVPGCISYGDYLGFYSYIRQINLSDETDASFRTYLKSINALDSVRVEYATLSRLSGEKDSLHFIYTLRNQFIKQCNIYLEPECAGLMQAMLTGDRGGISDEVSDAFQKAGVYHIVAISGLHLNIFICIIAFLFSKMTGSKHKKILMYLTCIAVGIFVLIFTGFGASLLRAFVMLFILALGAMRGREYNAKLALLLSAVIIPIFFPQYAFGAAMYLSLLSTYSILFTVQILAQLKKRKKLHKILSLNSVTIVVTSVMSILFTLPVTLFCFGYIPIYSFLANIVILPLMPFVMGSGLCFAACSVLLPQKVTMLLSFALNALTRLITTTAKLTAALPHATVTTDAYSVILVLSASCICLFVIQLIRKRGVTKAIPIFLLFCIAAIGLLRYNMLKDDAKISFVNIKQGDCTLLQLSDHLNLMVDAGSQKYDSCAENIVLPMLRKNGISKIDAIIVSHFHEDHVNAIPALIRSGVIKQLILPRQYDFTDEEAYQHKKEILLAALERHIPIKYICADSKIICDEDVYFDVLSPTNRMFYDNNNMSSVLKFHYGKNSVLFTGDIEEKGQKQILSKDIKCTILKAAHHGGNCDTTPELLQNTKPEFAVISCGKNNIYKHPGKETVAELQKQKIHYFRTDQNGTITFSANKEGIYSITRSGE